MDEPTTTRTKNVTTGTSETVHVGMEDEYPADAVRVWPLRASYTLCQRGKVRRTHRYLHEVEGAVTCPSCLAALETTEKPE